MRKCRVVVGMAAVMLVLCSMVLAVDAAVAGEKTLECRRTDQKELVGHVYFDMEKHAVTRKLKNPTEPARLCNEKYPNECNGKCWGCDNRAARHDECWDNEGEKHVPFWE